MDGTLTIPMHDFQEIRMRLGIPKHRYLGVHVEQEETVRARLEQQLESWEHDIAQRASRLSMRWSYLIFCEKSVNVQF